MITPSSRLPLRRGRLKVERQRILKTVNSSNSTTGNVTVNEFAPAVELNCRSDIQLGTNVSANAISTNRFALLCYKAHDNRNESRDRQRFTRGAAWNHEPRPCNRTCRCELFRPQTRLQRITLTCGRDNRGVFYVRWRPRARNAHNN